MTASPDSTEDSAPDYGGRPEDGAPEYGGADGGDPGYGGARAHEYAELNAAFAGKAGSAPSGPVRPSR